MTSHSQRRFGTGVALTPVEHAKKRLRRYLRNHPEGLSTGQLNAWIDSVRKGGVIKLPEFQAALREMTAAAEAVCSGGLWWLRGERPRPEPERVIDSLDLPKDGLFGRRNGT